MIGLSIFHTLWNTFYQSFAENFILLHRHIYDQRQVNKRETQATNSARNQGSLITRNDFLIAPCLHKCTMQEVGLLVYKM